MKYPDFSDRNTRTGTLGIVAVGALILAAPFIAQAATEESDPATTEVSAGGVTLHDADGNALQCTQASANDSADDGTGTWRWDCDGTKIQLRTDYTMTDEAERANAVTRMYWQASNEFWKLVNKTRHNPRAGGFWLEQVGFSYLFGKILPARGS